MPDPYLSSGPADRSTTLGYHASSDDEPNRPNRVTVLPLPYSSGQRQLPPLLPARTEFTLRNSRSAQDPERGRETLAPINYRETLRDVEEALHNADMALRNAREAFRSAGTNPNPQHNVVDLTNISSDGSTEDTFMVQTRHPQDPSRGRSTIRAANSFNEPPYGPPPRSSQNSRGDFTLPQSFRDFLEPNFNYQPIPPPFVNTHTHARQTDSNSRRADETAVRRQAQARRSWERVERRNRQRAEQQAQRDTQERDRERPQRQEVPQRSRRGSNESSAPSISDISDYSLSSSSTDHQDTANITNETMNSIDLTNVEDGNTLTALLAKEQQEAVNAQNKINAQQTTTLSGHGPTPLSGYKCAICMDSPTHATTTICGHLFCHRCIMDSLKWSEQLRRDEVGPGGRRNQGLCPVCRKPLLSKEVSANANSRATTGGVVGLEIKKIPRKQFETRKERDAFFEGVQEKGKQRAKTEEVLDIDAVKAEGEENENIKPLERGVRKRKRATDTARPRSSVSGDSLFGSP